jgi:hypothetical protein
MVRSTWIAVRNSTFLLGLLLLSPAPAPAKTPAEAWQGFRKTFPFPIQTVVVSAPEKDHPRTLIVSEPPPHVTVAGLKGCGPELIGEVEVQKHPVGHDGWVKDLVVTLKPVSDEELRGLVVRLHEYLFGSSIGAEVRLIPAERPKNPAPDDLDLKVTVPELRKWLIEDKLSFQSLAGGKAVTLNDILATRPSGVFTSATGGLVLWAFPRDTDLTDDRGAARQFARAGRQFAVSADLLIGAVGNKTHLVIVGRKRVIPTDILPPLRVETLTLLASVRTDSLAQSYERNSVFAGRYDDKWDWAPALLSPELVNTEYGNLLNVTDQLLKSWSNNGLTEYERFDYPRPPKYPFEKGVFLELGTNSLTYNWNTAGAGYAVTKDDLTWFGLNRTGALPVTYIPKGATAAGRARVAKYEETGYDNFARSGDPNLARVVSYAGAYQIFRHYRPTKGAPAKETPAQVRGHEVLAKRTLEALQAVLAADRQKIVDAAAKEAKLAGETDLVTRFALGIAIREFQSLIKDFKSATDEEALKELAGRIANPRQEDPAELKRVIELLAAKPVDQEDKSFADILARLPDRKSKIVGTSLMLSMSGSLQLLSPFADVNQVRADYVKAFDGQPDGWIRTPSVVISRSTGALSKLTGGHNLDAKVPVFRPAQVEPGKVRVVEQGGKLIIEYNPADWRLLPGLERKAGKLETIPGRDPEGLERLLNRELSAIPAPAPRTTKEALYNGKEPKPVTPALGRVKPGAVTDTEKATGAALLPDKGPVLIVARLDGNNYEVTRMDDLNSVEVRRFDSRITLLEYLDTAGAARPDQSRPLHLNLEGFGEGEAKGMLDDLGFHSKATERPPFLARILRLRPGETRAARGKLFAEYDFSKADIKIADIQVEDGVGQWNGLKQVTLKAEIPSRTAGKPSLWFRIRVFFDGAVTGAKDLAVSMVKTLFGTNFKTAGELDASLDAFRADAKKFGVRVQVEVYEGKETKENLLDKIEVKRDKGRNHAWSLWADDAV